MTEPLNLDEICGEWLVQCGPCDFGVDSVGCACPTGDYRPVMARLAAEIESLRRECAEAYGQGRDDEAAALPLRYPITP